MRFDKKVVLITGGAGGIGKAIARSFAQEGACVVIADFKEDKAKLAVQDIESRGGNALALNMDVTDSNAVNASFKRVVERYGTVHILINNAGGDDRIEPFIESKEENWDKLIALNLKGTIICSRAVLDVMVAQKFGKIINMGSIAGRTGSSGEALYSAAKGGVIAFTKALAQEVAQYKINVNCVCPGPTNTDLWTQVIELYPKFASGAAKRIPWGRIGKPEDVAGTVLFLASDDAEYITGQTICVDGGYTML